MRPRELLRRLTYRWGPRVASELRRRWLVARHPHVEIVFEGPVYLGPGFHLFCPEGGRLVVGPHVAFRRDFRLELHHGEVRIGGGTTFTYDVLIQCSSRIVIGERCAIGQSTMIVDGSHRFRDLDTPVLAQGYDLRPITIGDDVVVHSKVTVIADIGDRAVIGANAVVTRPVPPYTIAAGVPARVIEELRPSPA